MRCYGQIHQSVYRYLSQAIARQGERGADWKFGLKAVYGVFFLNFRLTDLPSKLRTDIVLADRDTHELFTDKMRYITLQRLPFKARNAVFKKLEEIVDIASMSKEERMRYDESIKVYRDQLAVMEFERNKGLAEGRAEEKENVARNLKRMGMDVETIAKATGLDLDVIESL